MRLLLTLFMLLCLFISSKSTAQITGTFTQQLHLNGSSQLLSVYIPVSYDSTKKHPLILGMHGCGIQPNYYRNQLVGIADSINGLVVVPNIPGSFTSDEKKDFLLKSISFSIDSSKYNIDTSEVYLTGFSCNGQEVFTHGWNKIYPFKGIIPFNAWLTLGVGDFNTKSNMPTCVCVGTLDPKYNQNVDMYNTYKSNGGPTMLIEIPDLGHSFDFNNRETTLLKCFNWFHSYANKAAPISNSKLSAYPNPFAGNIQIRTSVLQPVFEVYGLTGKLILRFRKEEKGKLTNLKKGVYLLREIKSNKYIKLVKEN